MRKLRSDITREGLARTPHRAFMRAMGLDDAAIQKPMIGVVSMKGEQTPCNMTHAFQVEAAKEGVAEAGGTRGRRLTFTVCVPFARATACGGFTGAPRRGAAS